MAPLLLPLPLARLARPRCRTQTSMLRLRLPGQAQRTADGKLEALNKDRGFKIDGKMVNFIAIDEGTTQLSLQASSWRATTRRPTPSEYDSWLLLEPVEMD